MTDAASPLPLDGPLAYRLTVADAAALAAVRPRWSSRRWWLLPVAACVVGTLWPLLDDAFALQGDARSWLVAVGLTLLVVVAGAAADRADRSRRAARIHLPRGLVRLTLIDEGILVEADGRPEVTRWAAIGAVDVTAGHVFVRWTPDSGIIVPRRAFARRADMDDFAAYVDARSAAAVD